MKKLSILLLLNLSFLSLFAQQTAMPAKCTNPGGGILVGGSFSVSPEFGCLDFTNGTANILVSNAVPPIYGRFSNLGYVFNFKDGDNIVFPSSVQTSATISESGTYWIMQSAKNEYDGLKYIACRAVEIIKTEQPDIEITACGDKSVTVTFLDTPKNKAHGRYRIIWEDGSQSVSPIIKSLPHSMTHTFTTLTTQNPYIVAEYTRGSSNFTACRSEPISLDNRSKPYPKITKFETDNSINQIKMEHLGNKSYKLLAQEKGKNTWDLVGNTEGFTNTMSGLDLSKTYYFKLSRKDDICQSAVESDTISNINLAFDYPNKISWNSLDDISSLKGKIEYNLQRGNFVNSIVQKFSFDQTNYLFSENAFEGFYNSSFRIRAKTTNIEILSNIFTLPPLSNESDISKSFTIYPNPSEEIIYFNTILQLKTAEIIDLQGKIIENQLIEDNQVSIKNLAKGKYILRLYNQEKKLLINKMIVKM